MNKNKDDILNRICYTELVYGRINKRLKTNYSKREIERMLFTLISDIQEECIQKIGKNFYVANLEKDIRITINSKTYRVITVDRVSKIKK